MNTQPSTVEQPSATDVAIIIPCLNEADGIVDAIHSAKATGAAEVIVVDGGSQDETVARAEPHARVLQADRPGRAVQQNLGARQTQASVLLFLHADCRLPTNAVRQIQDVLRDEQVIAGGFRQQIDSAGFRFRLLESGNAFRARRLGWIYGDQALFVRRSIFEQLGGFPDLRFMEDLYLSKRLKRAGRLELLDGPLRVSARRWHNRGVVRQTIRNWSLIAAASLGYSPDRLVKFYPNER